MQITYSTDNLTCTITMTCNMCQQPATVENVSVDALQRWRAGEHIQNAFPDMSAGDREILISGTHDECWNKLFPPDDEEFDEADYTSCVGYSGPPEGELDQLEYPWNQPPER